MSQKKKRDEAFMLMLTKKKLTMLPDKQHKGGNETKKPACAYYLMVFSHEKDMAEPPKRWTAYKC